MKTCQGHLQGYNAQAIVTADQCIVSASITLEENDVHQLEPMLSALEATSEAAGIEDRARTLAADAGYWDDQLDVVKLEQSGSELFIATANRFREAQQAEVPPKGRILNDITSKQRMTSKLRTTAGQVQQLCCLLFQAASVKRQQQEGAVGANTLLFSHVHCPFHGKDSPHDRPSV